MHLFTKDFSRNAGYPGSLWRRKLAAGAASILRHIALLAALLACAGAAALVTATHRLQAAETALRADNAVNIRLRFHGRVLDRALPAYVHGDTLLLPLRPLFEALGMAIRVEPDKGMAEGSFGDPPQRFRLDLNRARVEVGKRVLVLEPEDLLAQGDHWYVSPETLATWFPADFRIAYRDLAVDVVPRSRRFTVAAAAETAREPTPGTHRAPAGRYQATPYRAVGPRTTEIGLGYSIHRSSGGKATVGGDYALLSEGDLGFMASKVYLAGDDNDHLSNVRLSLQRDDPSAGMLGPLHATHLALGDVLTPDMPLLGDRALERGIVLRNGDSDEGYAFDSASLTGESLPGWDLEVYRNGSLIAYTTVGRDGRYQLDRLPLFYGNNAFELVFYGPNGQERHETRSYYVGPGMLPAGRLLYRVGATQKERRLIDATDNAVYSSDRNSARLLGGFDLGLTDSLGLATAIRSAQLGGTRRNVLDLGLRGAWPGLFLAADALHDTAGGDAWRLLGHAPLGQFDLRADYLNSRGYLSDDPLDLTNPLRWRAGLALSGYAGPTQLILSANRELRRDYAQSWFQGTLSRRVGALYFSNDLKLIDRNVAGSHSAITQGGIEAVGHFEPLFLRARLDYNLQPALGVESLLLSSRLRLDDSTSLNFDITRRAGLNPSGDTRFSAGLNWDLQSIIITPTIAYDTGGNYYGYLTANLSLGPDPRSGALVASSGRQSGRGAARVRVFEDRDGNGHFSAGDVPVAGARVAAVQDERGAVSRSDGIAALPDLAAYRRTDLQVERTGDPALAAGPPVSVVPRPGAVSEVDLPLTPTAQIRGRVLRESAAKRRAPVANAEVLLEDPLGRVLRQTHSDAQGAYAFTGVPLGSYRVAVRSPEITMIASPPSPVVLEHKGETAAGGELLLRPRPTPADVEVKAWAPAADESTPTEAAQATQDAHMAAAVSEPKPAPTPTPPALSADSWRIQLGAFASAGAAETAWSMALLRHGGALSALSHTAKPVARDGRTLYRVQAGPFEERAAAQARCRELQRAGQHCVVVAPETPKHAHRAAPATAPKASPKPRPASHGHYAVQLGAFLVREQAGQTLADLRRAQPALLGKLKSRVVRVDLGPKKGVFYRMLVAPGSSETEARALCRRLKARKIDCLVTETGK